MINIRTFIQITRLNKPTGFILLLWPCLWAVALTNIPWHKQLYYILLFIVGAIVMRAAGCIVNDLWDRKLDKNVERTASRPLASGEMNVKEAFIILAILSLIGLIILLQFNKLTIYIGLCSIILIIIYPLMKRVTFWPQLILGLAFNLGALMGGAAIYNKISIVNILLYLGGIMWTIGYDTIYAYQDIEDDKKIGIKSTAVLFGDAGKWWVGVFYKIAGVLFILSMIFSARNNYYNLYLIVIAMSHFIWQARSLKIDDPENCRKIFNSNCIFGLLLFLAFLNIKL